VLVAERRWGIFRRDVGNAEPAVIVVSGPQTDGTIAVVVTASRLEHWPDTGSGQRHIGRGTMKYFAGLDVSLRETAICIVDEDGTVVREGKAASDPGDLVRWLVEAGLTLARLGLEAGPLSPRLHAGLRAAGLPAICIENGRMKGATAAMAVKTDRNDARAIAQAMRVGWFTIVHVKSAQSQELRLLLSNRRTLLDKHVAIDNEIRGTLKAFARRDVTFFQSFARSRRPFSQARSGCRAAGLS
jgi:transposase